MASSTSTGCALRKGALVVAVWVALLHSSRGQQPPAPAPAPPLGCSSCSSVCAQRCQSMFDDRARSCETTYAPAVVYKGCLEGCANSTCKGKTCAGHVGSCTIGTCDPGHCGTPCVQDCCKSCTANAYGAYYRCRGSQSGSGMQSCKDGCVASCKNYYGCGNN